jgi:hypothetical protein
LGQSMGLVKWAPGDHQTAVGIQIDEEDLFHLGQVIDKRSIGDRCFDF